MRAEGFLGAGLETIFALAGLMRPDLFLTTIKPISILFLRAPKASPVS